MTAKASAVLSPVRLRQELAALLAEGAGLLLTETEALAERVHNARKLVKRARAWAALYGGAEAATLDRQLRGLHRAFAGRRDHDACLEALARLQARARGLQRELVQRLQAALQAPGEAAIPPLPLHALAAEFTTLSEIVAGWGEAAKAQQCLKGLAASYRCSRQCYRRAARSGGTVDLHRWRRWMKAQAYQFRYCVPLWPELLTVMAVAAEDTAECLGEHQDIELVRAHLDTVAWTAQEHQQLEALLRRVQQRLARQALTQGRRLHAESPKALRRRLSAYLAASRW